MMHGNTKLKSVVTDDLNFLSAKAQITLYVNACIILKCLDSLRDIAPDTVNYSSLVYLLQHEKKIRYKRTSTKKGEPSPIFNEAIIFSVPAHSLQVSSVNMAGSFTLVCLLVRCD